MRVILPIILVFQTPAAVSQAPSKDEPRPVISLEAPDGRAFRFYESEMLTENGEVEKKVLVPQAVLRDAKLMDALRKGGFTPVACQVDYSDIDAEQKKSDARRRAMRDKVIPLQHQYEQELYYRDRYAKRHEETCGKPFESSDSEEKLLTVELSEVTKFEYSFPKPVDPNEMTRKACEAIGVVCKPVKHW